VGPFYIVGGSTAGAITTSPAGTITDLSLSDNPSAMKAYNNVALTGYAASQSGAFQLPIGGPAAVAAGAGSYLADEEVAGSIIIPPGAIFAVSGTAVGTTHIVDASILWAEIDYGALNM
jgi:phage tail sheath gpL-like